MKKHLEQIVKQKRQIHTLSIHGFATQLALIFIYEIHGCSLVTVTT